MTPITHGADLFEDGYPHGTVDGFHNGCRGGACPGALDYGLSCKRAKMLSNSDVRYNRLAKQGLPPALIALELDEIHEEALSPLGRAQIEAYNAQSDAYNQRAVEPVKLPDPKPEAAKSRAALIRAWCAEQGITISAFGRIPRDIIDRYDQAHGVAPTNAHTDILNEARDRAHEPNDDEWEQQQRDQAVRLVAAEVDNTKPEPDMNEPELVLPPLQNLTGDEQHNLELADQVARDDLVGAMRRGAEEDFGRFGVAATLELEQELAEATANLRTQTEDTERARATAVRLEQELAHVREQLATAQRALALTLRKWDQARSTNTYMQLRALARGVATAGISVAAFSAAVGAPVRSGQIIAREHPTVHGQQLLPTPQRSFWQRVLGR